MKVITLARKPCKRTVAITAMEYGTSGININFSRIEAEGRRLIVGDYKETASSTYVGRMRSGQGFDGGSKAAGTTDLGRWPANLILNEACAEALDKQSGILKSGAMDSMAKGGEFSAYGKQYVRRVVNPASEGGASRFFKVVKS